MNRGIRNMNKVQEKANWKAVWTVRKYHTDEDYANGVEPYETKVVDGNLLLNEGIADMWDLIIGVGGTTWTNAAAMLGVGNSATAAAATDTGLIGASKFWQGMESTFPSRAAQTVTFRGAFATGDANFAWEEYAISNLTDDTSGICMNRKVQNLGTKVSGTWTLDLDVTLS